MPKYPSDDSKTMRVLRFLNVLDPDVNALSPTRIQAWVATLTSFGALAHTVLSVGASIQEASSNTIISGIAVLWAHKAHQTYVQGKRSGDDQRGDKCSHG